LSFGVFRLVEILLDCAISQFSIQHYFTPTHQLHTAAAVKPIRSNEEVQH